MGSPGDPQNVILIITFFAEVLSGVLLLFLGFFRVRAKKDDNMDKDSLIDDPLVRPGFTQMIILGTVNCFSALICLMKVMTNIEYGESEWMTYLQFGVCTPPLIYVLCQVCSVETDIAYGLSVLQGFVILCGYAGIVSPNDAFKYGWFAIGCFFFLLLFSVLIFEKRKAIKLADKLNLHSPSLNKKERKELEKHSTTLSDRSLSNRLIIITLATWSLYPVAWLVVETGDISLGTADIVHSTLAFVAKVTFSLVLAYYRSSLGYENVVNSMIPTLFKVNSKTDVPGKGDIVVDLKTYDMNKSIDHLSLG